MIHTKTTEYRYEFSDEDLKKLIVEHIRQESGKILSLSQIRFLVKEDHDSDDEVTAVAIVRETT